MLQSIRIVKVIIHRKNAFLGQNLRNCGERTRLSRGMDSLSFAFFHKG